MEQLPIMNIYNASAGAGKTYTLVQEYLKICLNPEKDLRSYREILAVTFTNKAAGEMQERILERLKDFASKDPQEKVLFNKFCNEWSISASALRKRSSDVLIEILHDYSSFSVSTIDKFMLRIVRSFALELGLNSGFEVFTDSKELISESVDLLMEEIVPNSELKKFTIEYAKNRLDNDKKWTFEVELKKDANFLLNETHYPFIKPFLAFDLHDFNNIKELIADKLKNTRAKFDNKEQEFQVLFNGIGADISCYTGGSRGICSWAKKLKNIDLKISLKVPTGLQEKRDWISAKGKKDSSAAVAIEGKEDALNTWLDESMQLIDTELGEYTILTLLARSVNRMALIGSIARKMEEYMDQESMLHIAEFNKKIAAFISKEVVPFVYVKMGDKYRYFFIDEFQDTSRLQWDNVYPLLENSLAEMGNVMLVGDAKQSIYRWRGGDVNILFEELEKINNPTSYQVNEINLPANWRSQKQIVEFNNALFNSLSGIFTSDSFKYIYDRVEQQVQKAANGYVEIIISEEKEEREDRYKGELKRILEDALERNWNYKDIALIARVNKDLKVLTEWLKEWNIPFINNESLLLKNNASVDFIIQVLQAITFPKKKEYQIFVLEFIYTNHFGKKGDFETWIDTYLRKDEPVDWITFLQGKGIDFNPSSLNQKGFYEWIEELLFVFSLEKDIYVNFFLDACLDYTKRHRHNIEGFLTWWEKKKNDLAIKTDASANAIEILTIHKSKGLEYPVVILPFLDWSRAGNAPEYWFDISGVSELNIPFIRTTFSKDFTRIPDKVKAQFNAFTDEEIFDMLNLLYVSTTRAVNELYLLSFYKKKSEHFQFVNDLIIHFLENQNWNFEEEIYSIGEKIERGKKEPETKAVQTYAKSDLHWRDKIQISRQAPEIWDLENYTTESEWGNLLHDAMADIVGIEDVGKAVRKQVNKRWLSKAQADNLKEEVQKIIDHSDLKIYFEEPLEVFNEQDICIRNGSIVRPDRFVQCKNGNWALIDYKTGAAFSDHKRQVDEYALLLTNMGYNSIEKVLVYTSNLEIKKWI